MVSAMLSERNQVLRYEVDNMLPSHGAFVKLPTDIWTYIQRMEKDLDLTSQLLTMVIEQLRQTGGEKRLPPLMEAFLDSSDPTRQTELVEQITTLVAQGQQPACVRQLRSLLCMTWDEVFQLYGYWPKLAAPDRLRQARRILLRQAMAAVETSTPGDTRATRP
jgi:hypothetical protein